MLARSALITRWNSNQVPWIHRGNCIESRPEGDCIMLARSALITQWNSNQVPWDPWLCILLAHGSMVVHTSGPWIQGCASCWPMDPRLCIESRPAAPTSPGPHGID